MGNLPGTGPSAAAASFLNTFARGGGGARRRVRPGPDLDDLVQVSSYGQPIARVHGTVRLAGVVIWAALAPSLRQPKGIATDSATRRVSVAVALSSRAIGGVRRIWAGDQLVVDAAGASVLPLPPRIYLGSEDQDPDPLIASLQKDRAPAYRGLAYAVFESLDLAPFGGRLPDFSFELVGTEERPDVGTIIADVLAPTGLVVAREVPDVDVHGFIIRDQGSITATLEQLALISNTDLAPGPAAFALQSRCAPIVRRISASEIVRGDGRDPRLTLAASAGSGSAAFVYMDVARDFLPSVQRAGRLDAAWSADVTALPIAASAEEMKAVAANTVERLGARRATIRLAMGFKGIALELRDIVAVEGHPGRWQVVQQSLEGGVVALDLERVSDRDIATTIPADSGRAFKLPVAAAEAVHLHVHDLPAGPGEDPTVARIVCAAALDDGGDVGLSVNLVNASGLAVGPDRPISTRGTLGVLASPLPPGAPDRWTAAPEIDVTLHTASMWLQSATVDEMLAGANAAAIGDEIVQFRTARALGGRRFVLSDVVRGQFGSRSPGWAAGERFTLLDPNAIASLSVRPGALPELLTCRLAGAFGNSARTEASLLFTGRSARPLSPVHLRAQRLADGSVHVTWVRRGRPGRWLDYLDVPFDEALEQYAVTLRASGSGVQLFTTIAPELRLSAAEQAARFGMPLVRVEISVVQLGAGGAGEANTATFTFEL